MKLFESYNTIFDNILDGKSKGQIDLYKRSRISDLMYKSNNNEWLNFTGANTLEKKSTGNLDAANKALFNFDQIALEKFFGKNKAGFENITIGTHPDFYDLLFDQYEYHHCVSMFVDIKGSTKLALKHSLEEVRLIKDTLLTICIHVANFFGGHVHRLQGDAAYIQFVRKGLHPNNSIINALNAATVLCQFVANDLARLFEKRQLNPIKIRVGIDYGRDNEVLWSHYGIPGCNELTTTSLHADIAAKLQARAASNSIMIGNNIITALDLPDDFYTQMVRTVNGVDKVEEYIMLANRYRQFVFDWRKYLSSFDFIRKNQDGTLEIVQRNYTIRCIISRNGHEETYFQNSVAIPKDTSIKYELLCNGVPYYKANTEEIIWEAHNRGNEAKLANQERHDFMGIYKNQNYCDAKASFLGHHFLKCTIKRQFGDNTVLRFPIYVL